MPDAHAAVTGQTSDASKLLRSASQPGCASVVFPASGGELKKRQSSTVLRPTLKKLPVTSIKHSAIAPRREFLTVRKSLSGILVEVMGREAAEKMIAEFGGARIWVPVRSTAEAKLTQILGDCAASALCARFGGDYLQVPNTITSYDVHRRIAELHRQGCKINDIALAVGRSRRTVFRLLRKRITDLYPPEKTGNKP